MTRNIIELHFLIIEWLEHRAACSAQPDTQGADTAHCERCTYNDIRHLNYVQLHTHCILYTHTHTPIQIHIHTQTLAHTHIYIFIYIYISTQGESN